MSHVSTVSLKIRDINALKMAVQRLGAQFIEGKTTYNWWGVSVGDTPLPQGMTKEMLGKCTHAIKVPGGNYEIGVVKMSDGSYTLAYDSYNYGQGPNGIRADGAKLITQFGDGLKKLSQMYGVCVASLKAKAQGWLVNEQTLPNGSIKLTCSGMR